MMGLDAPDLERLLREGQDRLRGRPQTWWERNGYRVRLWVALIGWSLFLIMVAAGAGAWVFTLYHFATKFW